MIVADNGSNWYITGAARPPLGRRRSQPAEGRAGVARSRWCIRGPSSAPSSNPALPLPFAVCCVSATNRYPRPSNGHAPRTTAQHERALHRHRRPQPARVVVGPAGRNWDFIVVGPGRRRRCSSTRARAASRTSTARSRSPSSTDYRDAILRCYWDGEATPSVEVPLGDFFGLAHARIRLLRSALVAVNPGLRLVARPARLLPDAVRDRRAHHARASRRARARRRAARRSGTTSTTRPTTRRRPTTRCASTRSGGRRRPTVAGRPAARTCSCTAASNLDGAENYVALEATGAGQMVGLLLEINNVAGGWYGEGDDMVFVDGEAWPPSIHGTGTEEIFGGGACPAREYAGPYHGFHLIESPRLRAAWSARIAGSSTTRSASRARCAGRSSTATRTTSRTSTRRSPTGTRPSRTRRSRRCPARDALRPPLPADLRRGARRSSSPPSATRCARCPMTRSSIAPDRSDRRSTKDGSKRRSGDFARSNASGAWRYR